MNRTIPFGVVGGYGATGIAVISQLLKSGGGDILIGGRDLSKVTTAAEKFGSRVSAQHLDIRDPLSLDLFCNQCSIIVNCAGPVMTLQDRVAQAAFRSRCHYIDVAGLTFVNERLQPHNQEIAALGLSFVVSAGWMPGISELVPAFAYARAKEKLDSIESLSVYFGDSGEWSGNALRDGLWYIRQLGLRSPGYFRKGLWSRAKMSAATRKVDLGDPVGPGQFSLFSTPELNQLGQRLNDIDTYIYTYLSGARAGLAAVLVAVLPLPERLSLAILRNIFRSIRLPVDGFVVAKVFGTFEERRHVLTAQVSYGERRDYWINGLVPATVARMILEGKAVQPGVHFLSEAVDPSAFMDELRKAGVYQTENFSPCE